MPDRLSRRLLVCLLALAGVALLAAGRANAGYGVAPNGQSFPVTLDSIGNIASPNSIDLVVYLDAQDSDAYVWVSESSAVSPSGSPAGGSVGSCSSSTLIPFGEQNKWVCRTATLLMKPWPHLLLVARLQTAGSRRNHRDRPDLRSVQLHAAAGNCTTSRAG